MYESPGKYDLQKHNYCNETGEFRNKKSVIKMSCYYAIFKYFYKTTTIVDYCSLNLNKSNCICK